MPSGSALWIVLGVEDYPFGLLTMIVSLEAIFLSTFVMISQNRADEKRQVIADQQWQTVQAGGATERDAAPAVQRDPRSHQGDPRCERPAAPVSSAIEAVRDSRPSTGAWVCTNQERPLDMSAPGMSRPSKRALDPDDWSPADPPRQPVLFVNPRSGGGAAGRAGVVERARDRGIEVVLSSRARAWGHSSTRQSTVARMRWGWPVATGRLRS